MKPPESLLSHPNPVAGYAEALERLAVLQARDGQEVHPGGRTIFLDHGRPTGRVVVWLHGYTNSPAQFARLGQVCFERGWNVLVPRMPRHALVERMTFETARLTTAELANSADEALDIAAGLGRQVVVGGFSMGGVLAGWLAQQRREVDLAVLLAPAFGLYLVPAPFTRTVTGLMERLPNFFQWWNPLLRESPAEADAGIGYPRYATRGLAAFLRLSFATQDLAGRSRPAARRIWAITSATDMAISQPTVERLVRLWRAQGASVQTHRFSSGLQLGHNFIVAGRPLLHEDKIYQVILDALEWQPT